MKCSMGFQGRLVMSSLYPSERAWLNFLYSASFISYKLYIMEPQQEIDLGKVDLDFGVFYQKGQTEGKEEAKHQDMRDHYREGVEYGRQWGLEFGYQMGFIDYLKELMKQSEIKLLKNTKIVALIEEIDVILESTTVDNCTIDQINHHRQQVSKKFKILLSMLNVKNQEKIPQSQCLDF